MKSTNQIPLSFTTQRTRAEKAKHAHKNHLKKILSNEMVQKSYNTIDVQNFINIPNQLSLLEKQWAEYGIGAYCFTHKLTSKFIGFAGFHTIRIDQVDNIQLNSKESNQELEIYILLMPEYWQQGYGYEIVSKLIHVAFSNISYSSIVAYLEPHNQASLKLFEKLNFDYEKEVSYNKKSHLLYRLKKYQENWIAHRK